MTQKYATEAELVADWLKELARFGHDKNWAVYPETQGWDLVLAHRELGIQVGVEAKLTFNPKVLEQALDGAHSYYRTSGPDFRAVLVPTYSCQRHMRAIARAIGITVLAFAPEDKWVSGKTSPLPGQYDYHGSGWVDWFPNERLKLPEYVPDVRAGVAAPVQLTDWKIKAIKLMIILEKRGYVTRADMKALQISPTRWTDSWQGFLGRGAKGQYIRCGKTPDLRKQHPTNYAEIEAQFEVWSKTAEIAI